MEEIEPIETPDILITTEQPANRDAKVKRALRKLERMNHGFWAEFRAFINKGNVMQLAIAFIMGATFTAIVNSLVGDIFMPLLGLAFGGVGVDGLVWEIAPGVIIKYGAFLMTILNFVLVALALFMVIKFVTGTAKRIKRLRRIADLPLAKSPLTKTEQLLTDIKNLLLEKQK